ncbi:endonuclease/exonuclease/phosphatase family protein [Streptomyces sp. WMMC905]|uniref:endonuclease/exonuclease/phosphatase family protein n=1 Tax=Streptomyces sp. WMMC905 TaxID=3404123 RepID=UPI003B939102
MATWNMCGVERWGCEGTGTGADKEDAVRRLVSAGVRVLLLQESCETTAESLRSRLGPSWDLAFRPYRWAEEGTAPEVVPCEDSARDAAGIAVLSADPLSSVRLVPTPQPESGLQRGVLCADLETRDIRVCNAHLTVPDGDSAHPSREYRGDQLRALSKATEGRRGVFGGDFNLRRPDPDVAPDGMWPADLLQGHRECAEAFRGPEPPTHDSGQSLDYLFTGLPLLDCSVVDTGVSDHRALLMGVDDRLE